MSRQQVTVGILGHVDHGKTSLVKALSGVDTDRLAEEKRRGLSIVLGFAYLQSEQGVVDLIDVPGHESFIRTMISGATGIDAVLLVVASDEVVKPQTREHLAIAQLLGIKQGLIAVTKSDLADEELLKLANDEIREYVHGTFLEKAPMHNVSITDQSGLVDLRQSLLDIIGKVSVRSRGDNFYLPLDRAFTIEGFGTVGTGTLRNGKIRVGDEVEIMPDGMITHVRELQVHNDKVAEALPGQRVAVNLRGIKREQLKRGHFLITPGSIRATTCLHSRLHLLDDIRHLPKRNESIRLLFGTTDVLAKLIVVCGNPLKAGAKLLVQIRCQQPVIVSSGEHFIVRCCSPMETIGGGKILDTSDSLINLPRDTLVSHLHNLEQTDIAERIKAHIAAVNTQGIDLVDLADKLITTRLELTAILNETDTTVINDSLAIATSALNILRQKALNLLSDFHSTEPTLQGQGLEQFKLLLGKDSQPVIIDYLIKMLCAKKLIVITGSSLRLADFDLETSIDESDRALIDSIEDIYRNCGASTPALDEVTGTDPAKKRAYQYLKDNGKLIPLRDTSSKKLFIFHSDNLDDFRQKMIDEFPPPQKFTVSDMRTLLHSTRKYVIPILEHFDRSRLTMRQGDYRTLMPQSLSQK